MYGHLVVYESLNSCTCAHFCCGLLEPGSPIAAFRFSLCVSIGNLKITTPKVYCVWPGIEHNKGEHAHFQHALP